MSGKAPWEKATLAERDLERLTARLLGECDRLRAQGVDDAGVERTLKPLFDEVDRARALVDSQKSRRELQRDLESAREWLGASSDDLDRQLRGSVVAQRELALAMRVAHDAVARRRLASWLAALALAAAVVATLSFAWLRN